MKIVFTISLAVVALLARDAGRTCAFADELSVPPRGHIVMLSQGEAARLGVATQPAQRAKYTPEVRGYGVVVNLANLAQTDSDIRTALAAVTDSEANMERMIHLFGEHSAVHAASEQALYAARHQAASDKAQLALADRKEVATFGQNAPWRGAARNDAMLDDLAAGRSALVQATFPLGIVFVAPPPLLIITRLDPQPGQKSWTSNAVWDAPADPTIPGRSFFAVAGHSELAQGEHVLIFAPTGAPVDGVSVPVEAVVLSEDKPWCYIALPGGRFQRVPIDLRLQLAGGYFVAKGIAPSQPIVVKGTGLLLARELGAATPEQE
jgi:hypothetical protein